MASTGPPTTTTEQEATPRRRTGRFVAGIILTAIGILALALGGTLIGLHLWGRGDDGFYEIHETSLRTPTRALVSESVEVDLGGAWIIDADDLGDIRIDAMSPQPAPVFVGIGPTDAVRAYLAGVTREEADFTDGDLGPRTAGARAPAPPGSMRFWVASAEGTGRQSIIWPVSDGAWSAVVMNADGAPGVDVETQLGFRSDLVIWVAAGALAFAALLLAIGIPLLVTSRRAPAYAPPPPPPPPPPPAEPA